MDYFYKVPIDLTDYFENDYKQIMVRLCLERYSNIEGVCFTSISLICEKCGYSVDRHNKSFLAYVRKTLVSLVENNEITQIYGNGINSVSVTGLVGFYLEDKFYSLPTKMFAKLSYDIFDTIIGIDYPLSKPTLLKVYTYIRGRIIENGQQAYGFYGSVERAVKDLDLNRKTVDVCLDLFVDHNLFIKYTTGSCYINGEPRNVPNIYVLPDDQAENNIKALLEELKQRYRVEDFAPALVPSTNNK
ncbi:hypothetical protein [uncultured Clostridium sp.]|uniref:hypothetical protein n=1 Tax=uncultured Clostridium sp. TaxID=59620 RepID=UPI0025D94AF1|nr:hypothetical protein [uncultured Clostridium sp.]